MDSMRDSSWRERPSTPQMRWRSGSTESRGLVVDGVDRVGILEMGCAVRARVSW